MYTKIFALFAFATVAVAQDQFPNGDFYIHSLANPSLCVAVQGASTLTGAVIVPEQMTGDRSQIWRYNTITGTLTNLNANADATVLTAPINADASGIITGQPLTQEIHAQEPDDVNQIWVYQNAQIHSLLDTSLCMTLADEQVVMLPCSNGPETRWTCTDA